METAENPENCAARNNRDAIKRMRTFVGGMAGDFGPKRIKEIQAALIAEKLARSYANAIVARIKGMFAWGVSEELVEETVYRALRTVHEIKPGKGATETVERDPVPSDVLEATIARMLPHQAAMVRLQSYTGVRSRSACLATPSQFNRRGEIWEWRPRHKSENKKKKLRVPIGPKCQEAIGWLFDKKGPKDFLFSPRDSFPGNKRPGRLGLHYTRVSYRGFVVAAINKVNKKRAEENLPPIEKWFPHRLRHTVGALVNDQWGEEGAAAMLGHHANVTKLYTQKRYALAAQIAALIG